MADRPLLLTVPDFAREFRFSNRTAWALVQSGAIESVKIGALRRIPRDAVDRYLESLREANRAAAV